MRHFLYLFINGQPLKRAFEGRRKPPAASSITSGTVRTCKCDLSIAACTCSVLTTHVPVLYFDTVGVKSKIYC
jgi:hypothetical protein